ALVIAPVSMFLTHGFNKRTLVAVSGTVITLAAAWIISAYFVSGARLIGIQDEHLFYVKLSTGSSLNLADLLIAAIIVGTLGVLEDITISQVATVFELKCSNSAIEQNKLYSSGIS